MKTVAIISKAIFQTKGLSLLAATAALSIGIAVSAALPAASLPAQTSPSQPAQLEKFRGEISPDPDTGDGKGQSSSYELYDESRATYFFLDGKQTRKPLYKYAGNRVEITGTLDAKSRIIHIDSIKTIHW